MKVSAISKSNFLSSAATAIDALLGPEMVDLEIARKVVGDNFCLWGNVALADLASGTFAEFETATREAIEKGVSSKENFVLISGCRVHPEVPPENIMAMVKVAKAFSKTI